MERTEKVRAARQRFFQGLPVEPGSVRDVILESWNRSYTFGVKQGAADKSILPLELLQKRIRERQGYYDIASPVLKSLYKFIFGSGFLLLLCDEDGYVLKAIGDGDIVHLTQENGLVEGCNRSERRLGTNGVGTPLETRTPLQVFGPEHYFQPHNNWVCSGAPIFYPNGAIAGVFCMTGTPDKVSPHTLGMVVAAADAITRQLKMKETYDALEHLQRDLSIIIETWHSGILLLDNGLKIRCANSRAARLLMLDSQSLVGKSFPDMMDDDALREADLRMGITNRHITLERGGQTTRLSVSVQTTSTEEYVVLIEKAEALHRKVNRIIGADAHFTFDDIIGSSPALNATVQLAKIGAQNNSNVLLTGESGTGKELFAQAIHNASSRRDGPFIAINCGALPKSLIESELFGYEGGSFTGAKRDGSAGKFELANGGTIFLDEVGDMPFDVQVSLLRVLQSREVSRIGSGKNIKIDVRIISATNQNLQAAIENNAFRSDLYYRLNVFCIRIPPLRERAEDIRHLADYFCSKYATVRPGQKIEGFREEVYRAMERYPWPGNVRELENAVERAVYLARSSYIEVSDLALQEYEAHMSEAQAFLNHLPASPAPGKNGFNHTNETPPESSTSGHKEFSIKDNERMQIENALLASGGNVKQAAAMLEISRRTMYRKMERYGINCDSVRQK